MSNDEDAWNLEDSDGEGTSTHTTRHIKAGSSSGTDHIARVAAQAGLGRRAGPASSASSGSRTHGLNNGSTASIIAFPSSLSSSLPTAAAVAASLNGGTASAIQSTSLAQASTSSAILSKSPPPPSTTAEKRGRQTSYGFWGRLSGAVGVGSSSSPKESSSKSTDNLAEMSGYSRFDDQLELEDNFDGTYSVNPGSASGGSVGAGSGGKLMAAASIARPSLLAAGNARSLGKVPQVPASGSSASKGKSRLTDSPGGATIVGTPRPRSPFTKLKKLDRPRDEEEMRKYVRKDIDDVLQDPANLLKTLSLNDPVTPITPAANLNPLGGAGDYYTVSDSPPVPSSATFAGGYDDPLHDQSIDAALDAAQFAKEQAQARRDASRKEKFLECLKKDTVDIAELRKLAWAGIPTEVRPIAWQLLLGYLPSPSSRRVSVLARKRQEYADAVSMAFSRGESSLDPALWHQIQIDVPRTNPGVPLWQFESTQRSLERILYVWAIRHPASGYVQGINDLATPFFQVFLSSYIDCDPEDYDISALPSEVLSALEADTFWCLSKLLDGIQDNYIFAQPGIHRQVARCQELCARVDSPLAKHLEAEGVSFLQFSFRWFHLLFLRVLPVNSVIRMWDTYMSEGSDAFANFHTYVCLAFLLRWSEKLRAMDFQAIMLFLQDPVDHETWSESQTELLLSEAYMWSALWSGTKNATSK